VTAPAWRAALVELNASRRRLGPVRLASISLRVACTALAAGLP
jgi:hypothetical protein